VLPTASHCWCARSGAEGGDRYRRLFAKHPPAIIAQFAERVPITKGRWDSEASTATSYAWFVFRTKAALNERGLRPLTHIMWIPPDCRKRLTRADDVARFAAWSLRPADSETGGML
jgi:hypothetical protein